MKPDQKNQVKKMPLRVFFEVTEETFSFKHVTPKCKIRKLKEFIELETGIPFELQKLFYLDAGDLPDDQTIKKMDIVSNAVINMHVWHTWKDLVDACCTNDIEWLLSMGVTKDSKFQTPTSQYMLPKQRREWLTRRAGVALFIACHRAQYEMASKLLQAGADVNSTTSLGRSPLHVAAAKNNGDIINLLLESGANVDLEDANGQNPLSVAADFGHKGCERRLFMFRWQQRAKSAKPQYLNPPLMEFQRSDSSFPKWRTGSQAQVYLQKVQPPGEFIGSSMHANRRAWHRRGSTANDEGSGDCAASEKSGGMTFEQWQARKVNDRRRELQMERDLLKVEEAKRNRRQMEIEMTAASGKNYEPDQFNSLPPLQQQQQQQQQQQHRQHQQQHQQHERVKHRIRIDPNLNAYEQWLFEKQESSDAADPSRLPYQLMLHEFCDAKGLLH